MGNSGEDGLRHLRELTERMGELSTLMGLSALVSSQLPLPDILEEVCRLSAEVCRAEVAYIHLADHDEELVCLARHAPNDSVRHAWEGVAEIYGRRAITSGQMASRSSLLLRADGDQGGSPGSRMGGICAVPLKGSSRIVGTMAVGYRGPHRFSAREKDMLNAISAQLAMAVERSWLLDRLQEELARANSLRHVANRIISKLDLDLVLDSIVDHASKLLAAEFSAILLLEESHSGSAPVLGRGAMRGSEGGAGLQPDEGPLGRAVQQAIANGSAAIALGELPEDGSGTASESRPGDYRAALAVPLLAGEEVLGALAICYLERRRFDKSDVSLAEDFAAQATIAIQNARLYEEAMQHRLSIEAAINQINNHGISILDERLNMKFANHATFWLVGAKPRAGTVPAEEWIGLLRRNLEPGCQLDWAVGQLRERPEEALRLEFAVRTGGPRPRKLRLLSIPLRRSDGAVRGRVNLLEELA